MDDLSNAYESITADITTANLIHDEEVVAISKEHAVAAVFNESAKNNLIDDIYLAEDAGIDVEEILDQAHLPFEVDTVLHYDIIEEPEVFDNVIDEPYQFDNVIDEPEVFDNVIDEPEVFDNVIVDTIVFDNVIDEPEVFDNVIDEPYQFDNVIDEPEVFDNVIDEPYYFDNVTDEPEVFDNVIDEPETAEDTLDRIVCRNGDCFESIKQDVEFDSFLSQVLNDFSEVADVTKLVVVPEAVVRPIKDNAPVREERPVREVRGERNGYVSDRAARVERPTQSVR